MLALLGHSAFMTFHSPGVNVALRLLVIPLLIGGSPNLPFPTMPAGKRTVDVIGREFSIGIDVAKA